MTITLYTTKDENNVVDKTLTTLLSVTATVRDASDVVTPTITIDYSNFGTINPRKVNYVYISENARYYYVTDLVIKPHNIIELSLKSDVLMSFKTGLRKLTGTLTRSETVYNGYIPDAEYQALAYSQVVTKTFPSGLTNDCFILMTVG